MVVEDSGRNVLGSERDKGGGGSGSLRGWEKKSALDTILPSTGILNDGTGVLSFDTVDAPGRGAGLQEGEKCC